METNQTEARLFQAGDPLELTIQGVPAVFRYCPPGKFIMGSREGERAGHKPLPETRHEVTLTREFWLMETQVTQTLWTATMGENPSCFKGDGARPVESILWTHCESFIRRLNFRETPPYGLKFDFPTEAEWEYACRAGTETAFNVGEDITDEDANFGKHIGQTTPVKSYAPNAWGLYDMHGNVEEWCFDQPKKYSTLPLVDPVGRGYSEERVLRGGGWADGDRAYCRSAYRNCSPGDYPLPGVAENVDYYLGDIRNKGFRLALRAVRMCELPGDRRDRLF